jgi:phage terminase small subunit
MGNTAKPVVIKKQEGTYRADRDIAKRPVDEALSQLPKPIPGMNKDEVKWWKYYGPELIRKKLITQDSLIAFAGLVHHTAEFFRYKKYIEKNGDTFGNEFPRIRPEVNLKNQEWKMVLECMREFGMTPASSMKVPTGNSDYNEILNILGDKIL